MRARNYVRVECVRPFVQEGGGSMQACAGGLTRVGQHLQNVGSLDNEDCIPYKGWSLKLKEHLRASNVTPKQKISARESRCLLLEGSCNVVKDGQMRRTGRHANIAQS